MAARLGLFILFIGCLGWPAWLACAAQANQPVDGAEALRSGEYAKAIELFAARIEEQPADVRAHRGLVQAYRDTGRYREAERAIQEFERSFPASVELAHNLGEIYYATGRSGEAREAFQRSIAGAAPDALSAEIALAVLDYERGRGPEAMERFDRFIDVYNLSGRAGKAGRLSSADLTAVGTACRYLGVGNPQLFKDALRAFDEAAAVDPLDLEPKIRAGELFLEKHNSTDAGATFQEVLTVNPHHPRALLGMARVMDFENSPEVLELVQKALEVNPQSVEARVFLAREHLDIEDYERASAEAERALEVNPVSLEALSILAAASFLKGDVEGFEKVRARVLEQNPIYAEFYNTLSDICVQNRLYRQAVEFSRQAVLLDDRSWRGYGLLGLNQLRLGDVEEGKTNLERSFAGDPYNVWIKNTLDLLDTFPDYRETKSDRFLLVIDGKESDLLAPYVMALAEEAYDRLAERYQYRPETPIRIEVYPSHADFSVRTIGLAGLGALGVCFGPVIAIDSPSAREKGGFNWGSTLWHELGHTVTLGMTDHRVPRWVSEGLSVYEEHRARPGWGDDVSIPFLIAYQKDMLLPIADLNNGFIRPSNPHQIGNSYYQASLVFELIERDHGFPAILKMLDGYKKGLTNAEVFQAALGIEPEAFDKVLADYLEERFSGPASVVKVPSENQAPSENQSMEVLSPQQIQDRLAKDPRDFGGQLAMGEVLFQQGKLEEALDYLKQAQLLFPEYGGDNSPYWYLAQIYRQQGELGKAAEELAAFTRINESHYEAHLALAEIRESLGDLRASAEALGKAVFIYPLEMAPHRRLAEIYGELGEFRSAIRERQAVVALAPVDRAQALYELAFAHYQAGDLSTAKREVLRALEVAPNFEEAQDLLLRLLPDASRKGSPAGTVEDQRGGR